MPTLNVHFLPVLTTPAALSGSTVVVIDVLRATTTIATALAAGATEVIPCLEVDEARQIAASLPPGKALLGGERGGKRIDGFDLGNSPAEYTPERLAGNTLVITTTNGTKALQTCLQASAVWLGALVNLTSVVRRIVGDPRIDILCAGTDGHISHEDVLTAGLFVHRILKAGRKQQIERMLGDGATIAHGFALARGRTESQRRACFASSRGGANLVELGYLSDIHDAVRIDAAPVAPRWDLATGRITAS